MNPRVGVALEWLEGRLRGFLRPYLFGLTLHLAYLLVLFASPVSRGNLQLPEGRTAEKLWKGRDVMSYVLPARNFLEHGVFGQGSAADHHRTVGYPFFLASMMWLFGQHWLPAVYVIQAALFALFYPLLAGIGRMAFGREYAFSPVYLFTLFAGTYWSKAPIIMTDCFFSLFLTIGFYFGMRSVRAAGYVDLLLYVSAIGVAAQVRPTLVFYPFIHLLLYPAAASCAGRMEGRSILRRTVVLFLLLAPLCNAPILRNSINHGLLKPADTMEKGLFEALARDVLIRAGRAELFAGMEEKVAATEDLHEKLALKRSMAVSVYRSYPLATIAVTSRNAVRILGSSHLLNVGHFWGWHWCDFNSDAHMRLRASSVLAVLNVVSYLAYTVIIFYTLLWLCRQWRAGQWLPAAAVLLLLAYLLLPTFMLRSDARVRLPAEGLMLLLALRELFRRPGPPAKPEGERDAE